MSVVLAISTSTAQVSVALGGPDGAGGSLTVRQGRRHGETLAPAIQSLTRLTGIPLDRVGRVAVDVGPGLFTGLRVGVATAKAMASALGVDTAAATSLDLLAEALLPSGRPVVAVVDARRGEVFWARYHPGPGPAGTGAMEAETAPAVATPEALAAELAGTAAPVLLCGDGARRYAAVLTAGGVELAGPGYDHPRADVLVELAAGAPAVAPDRLLPSYIRGADVRIGWEQRA